MKGITRPLHRLVKASFGRLSMVLVLALAFGSAAAQQSTLPIGTRLTYYAASASIPGARQALTPDANGGWVNQATGERYGVYDVPGAAGHGYTQVDIVYADADVCVGHVTTSLMDSTTSAITTAGIAGFVTRGGACDQYWLPASQLANFQPQQSSERRVSRGQLPRSSGLVDVVGIVSWTSNGSTQQMYDLASGFLLVSGSTAGGGAVLTPGTGDTSSVGSGSTSLAHTNLQGVRQLLVPSSGPLPQHVHDLRELQYDCLSTMQAVGGALSLRCRQTVQVVAGGSHWLALRLVLETENPLIGITDQAVSEGVLGAGQLGGFFMAPGFLGGLQAGAVLDEDAITGARLVVTAVSADAAVLELQNRSETTRLTYDRASGWLVDLERRQSLGMSEHIVHLRLANVE